MVRKFAAALVALVIAVGSIFADEFKGVFVKFADGTLTLKGDDGKEKEFKIPEDLKIKRKGKDGEEKEFPVTKMLESKFMKEGVTKLTVVHDGDKVTEVKVERKGK
jgi:hypothetical protein